MVRDVDKKKGKFQCHPRITENLLKTTENRIGYKHPPSNSDQRQQPLSNKRTAHLGGVSGAPFSMYPTLKYLRYLWLSS